MILDSGNRTEFASGAVRDIKTENGRCDLMPLDIVARILDSDILAWINKYMEDGDVDHLTEAIKDFIIAEYDGDKEGAMLEVSKHYKEGAEKYGENNWKKGIDCKSYIDSAVRHYLKWERGDDDEPHERAFIWNLMGCMWTQINMPELGVKHDENGKKNVR